MRRFLTITLIVMLFSGHAFAGEAPGIFEGICHLELEDQTHTSMPFSVPLSEMSGDVYRGWTGRLYLGGEYVVSQIVVREAKEHPEMLEVLDAIVGTYENFSAPRTESGVRSIDGQILIHNGAQITLRYRRSVAAAGYRHAYCNVMVKLSTE